MIINSVSNVRYVMEEKFCSLLPVLTLQHSNEIAVKIIMGLIDYEIEIYEDLVKDTIVVKDRPKEDKNCDIMEAYYLGEGAAYNARIRRYKNRITQLKKIKEQFYEKVT